MRRKLFGALGALCLMVGLAAMPLPALAAPGDGAICQNFLTFPSWCRGLDNNGDGEIDKPVLAQDGVVPPYTGEASIPMGEFVWKIVGNITEILLQIVGYGSVFMMIFGGIKYMTAYGSVSKIDEGTKTMTRAMTGLVIGALGSTIIGTIVSVLGTNAGTAAETQEAYSTIIAQAAIILGIAAVIIVLYGAFLIITSNGNATRMQKGKATVMYACIGLALIILSAVIANIVLGGVMEGSESL